MQCQGEPSEPFIYLFALIKNSELEVAFQTFLEFKVEE
jgi:hypothetical protein